VQRYTLYRNLPNLSGTFYIKISHFSNYRLLYPTFRGIVFTSHTFFVLLWHFRHPAQPKKSAHHTERGNCRKQLPQSVPPTMMVGAGNCHGWCHQSWQLVAPMIISELQSHSGLCIVIQGSHREIHSFLLPSALVFTCIFYFHASPLWRNIGTRTLFKKYNFRI